ncbi:hypothetical protein VP01_11192g2, partial [Puccinia sorghi]
CQVGSLQSSRGVSGSKERGECVGTRLKEKIYASIKRRKPGVVKAIQTFCKRRSTLRL